MQFLREFSLRPGDRKWCGRRRQMKPWEFKSAGDLGLTPEERLHSLRRESGLTEFLSSNFWRLSTRAALRAMHGLDVVGSEHIPQELPFILVGNHSSHLDSICLAALLRPGLFPRVFPIAAADTFFTTRARSLFAALTINALPLDRKRGGSGQASMLELRERLLAGNTGYILFPEGTRSRDGNMNPFKKGIGMLVAGTPVPVVPCCIRGAFEAFPPTAKLPKRKPVSIKVLPPIRFDTFSNTDAGWKEVAELLEAAIRAGLN